MLLCNFNALYAQDDGFAALLGVAAIGAAVAAQENLEEELEYAATNFILDSRPEITYFKLKTIKTNTKTNKDKSKVNIVPFGLENCTEMIDGKCDPEVVLMSFSNCNRIALKVPPNIAKPIVLAAMIGFSEKLI